MVLGFCSLPEVGLSLTPESSLEEILQFGCSDLTRDRRSGDPISGAQNWGSEALLWFCRVQAAVPDFYPPQDGGGSLPDGVRPREITLANEVS